MNFQEKADLCKSNQISPIYILITIPRAVPRPTIGSCWAIQNIQQKAAQAHSAKADYSSGQHFCPYFTLSQP